MKIIVILVFHFLLREKIKFTSEMFPSMESQAQKTLSFEFISNLKLFNELSLSRENLETFFLFSLSVTIGSAWNPGENIRAMAK